MTILPNILTFIDVETTGLSPIRDRIIEIGILRMENGRINKRFSSLVNPEAHLPPEITMLTGITARDLENAPVFSRIAPEILTLMSDSMFVAHNAKFDYSFIKNEFMRLDMTFQSEQLDTAKLSRALFPRFRRHNLDSLISRHGFSVKNRHRALDDAQVLAGFWTITKKQFNTETLLRAVSSITKSSAVPPGLSRDSISGLPEAPGVYLFYDADGKPIYIGKSINIRDRVRSHFYDFANSGKEARIFNTVGSIEARKTSGELGALLLESQLIKQYQPLYNRMLRKTNSLIAVYKTSTPNGYYTISPKNLNAITPDAIDGIVSIFRTIAQMKKSLMGISEQHNLCRKLLGLEKTRGACFGAQLKTCHGACIQNELPARYNLRFTEAFAKTRIRQWPFPGPIGIKEGNAVHVVNTWCYLGILDEHHDVSDLVKADVVFDYDTYKILSSHLLKKSKDAQIMNIKTLINSHRDQVIQSAPDHTADD